MFEISWSELLILGIVTLIFVGPKELPIFLRTLGRYAGVAKRQVGELRAQFEVVIREAELDQMSKEVEAVGVSVNAEVMGTKRAIDATNAVSNKGIQPDTLKSSAEARPEHRIQPTLKRGTRRCHRCRRPRSWSSRFHAGTNCVIRQR